MIFISKVITKKGDKGQTLGPKMQNVNKSSIAIEFIGSLDQLNVTIGESILLTEFDVLLEKIQHQLFDIGAKFYQNEDLSEDYVIFLEKNSEIYNKNLPPLDSFLLPNGTHDIISLHKNRVIARNTERIFWKYEECNNFPNIGKYLNRLSDLFFILLRKNSKKKWIPFNFNNY